MGINEGNPIEIVKVNNDIVMRKYSKGCIFCGSNEEVVELRHNEINNKSICQPIFDHPTSANCPNRLAMRTIHLLA